MGSSIPWKTHTSAFNHSGNLIGDLYNYDTADIWSANHYLPSNLAQFNEAAAQVFVGDLAREAFGGAFLADAAPTVFSYEPYFGSAYDFGIGSYDINFDPNSYAIVGFTDYGLGWDATAYNYWEGWTGQYDAFPTYIYDDFTFGDFYWPVVLDLDGDGVDILPRTDSTVYFDVDNDGFKEQTAWAGPTDGLLIIDLGANGSVTPRQPDRSGVGTRLCALDGGSERHRP